MSNLKRNLFIFCLLIFVSSTLISCSPEAVNVEMEIITFSSFKDTTATKYPAEIIEIGKPLDKKNFSSSSKEKVSEEKIKEFKNDVGFAPLIIKREDLGELKFPIDYMTNKGLTYTNTNAIANSYKKYFDTASIDGHLNSPQKPFDLTGYLADATTRENVFVYSSNDRYTFGKALIFHSTSDLRDAIQLAIYTKGIKKVIVLYEPQIIPAPTPSVGNSEIRLKSKSLTELRNAVLSESYSKMFNKDYTPQNIKFDPMSYSFSCDLLSQKSNFTKISLAWGPVKNSCESCTNILNKNPGSQVLFETKDQSLIYKIIAIGE